MEREQQDGHLPPKSCERRNFMCGVVEGFYGRPWTTEQRKDLFQKMRRWQMDSYLYAPKDDYKHRAYWRELYTVEETEHLGSLITAAKENGITFIYAISPGLDITYSSSKDVTALKRKLEQVNQLGCDAFAILFDDIDTEMSKADKEIFKSFAYAQVAVTNEAFQHINVSKFLFCPTQYCGVRAIPTVTTSEYLKTIGAKLDLRIDIFWTGPKVISKDLTMESIEEIAHVLRRDPVIWDNLHANDYDTKRVFLGPYSGRSPQLIPRLRGVLTNPNCEYGCNFIAINTLAQWSRCSVDAKKKIEESMNADAKLETENDDNVHVPNLDPHVYHPSVALKTALQEWLLEFKRTKSAWGPIMKPQIVTAPEPILPPIPTCISVPSSSTTTTSTVATTNNINSLPPSLITSTTDSMGNGFPGILASGPAVMNSLAADNKIVCASSVQSITMNTSSAPSRGNILSSVKKTIDLENPQVITNTGLEPMDTATPPNPSPPDQMIGIPENNRASAEDVLMMDREERNEMSSSDEGGAEPATPSGMNVDTDIKLNSNSATLSNTPSSTMQVENQESLEVETDDLGEDLQMADLLLMCDLYYLPFEHGNQGLQILNEFQWLKREFFQIQSANRVAGISAQDKEKPEVIEWYERAMRFEELSTSLKRLLSRLTMVNNRELLYELYPYVWDMTGVVSLLNSYIKFLAESMNTDTKLETDNDENLHAPEHMDSHILHPIVALKTALQRLIPLYRGTDLYVYNSPAIPSAQTYSIRPYRPADKDAVYKICLSTFKDGMSAADDFIMCPKLAGDVKVGGYLALDAELIFVVEDENEVVVGIAIGALNGKEFRRKLNVSWIPMLKERYPPSLLGDSIYAKSVLSDLNDVPDQVAASHPAELRFAIMAPLVDPSVPKRLLTCILAALRASGVSGCYVEVPFTEKYSNEFYKKLGFIEMCPDFLVRSF